MEKISYLPNGQWVLEKSDNIVAYHGTKSPEPFDSFRSSISDHGSGVFAATDFDHAKKYSDGLIAETHINTENPISSDLFDEDARKEFYGRWEDYLSKNPSHHLKNLYNRSKQEDASDISTHILQEAEPREQEQFINMLKRWGHDAITNSDLEDESKISYYHVLDPSKINIHKWHNTDK